MRIISAYQDQNGVWQPSEPFPPNMPRMFDTDHWIIYEPGDVVPEINYGEPE